MNMVYTILFLQFLSVPKYRCFPNVKVFQTFHNLCFRFVIIFHHLHSHLQVVCCRHKVFNHFSFVFSGIMCPHRGAVFSYNWRHQNYPFQEGDRVACNVFFVWEMYRPLLKGEQVSSITIIIISVIKGIVCIMTMCNR